MPQWQGGNLPAYHFGAQLLAWLAPETGDPVAEVKVDPPTGGHLPIEAGIVGRSALLAQARSAKEILIKNAPEKVVVFGGDCLVDLAPFAYLNEKYEGDFAVLWVDSHPDVMTPEQYSHAHAHVLGNLLGEGDPEFVAEVKRPLSAKNVMYAGMDAMNDAEQITLTRLGLKMATPDQLRVSSEPVLEWLRSTGANHLAIHLDLDVLDPTKFRSLIFSNPRSAPDEWAGVPQGKMSMMEIVRMLNDVANQVDIVGLGITEHLPWDALALKQMLEQLPLLTSR
jgi:arginase